jgi:hypothetical protein
MIDSRVINMEEWLFRAASIFLTSQPFRAGLKLGEWFTGHKWPLFHELPKNQFVPIHWSTQSFTVLYQS